MRWNMEIVIRKNQMEEVEGLTSEYPYTLHVVDIHTTKIRWHWHEELEFCYVASGEAVLKTVNNTYHLKTGEAVFMNTNVLCTMQAEKSCIIHSHIFHSTLLSGHFRSVFETKYMQPILQNKKIEVLKFEGINASQQKIIRKLCELSKLQENKDTEFATRNVLSEIWMSLLEEIENQENAVTPAASVNQERLLHMLSYIHEHYAEKISLEDIAGASAISKREALRCFQSGISQPPFDYLQEYRLQVAKRLLTTTQASIAEIALECGFGSSAYFGKVFKEKEGMTPKLYRDSIKE